MTTFNHPSSQSSANFRDRRKNPRVSCRLKATRSSKEGFFLEDEIFNISRSGFFLYSTQDLRFESKIDLMVTLMEGNPELALQGEVTHVERVSEQEKRFLNKPFMNKAGVYLNFVEPSQKELLDKFIESLFEQNHIPSPSSPTRVFRIRIDLNPDDSPRQMQLLQGLRNRGLFIEVSYPVSIFDQPQIRLVNPLSQEKVDLMAEITQAIILPFPHQTSKNLQLAQRKFGMGVRFPEIKLKDQEALDRLVLSLGGRFIKNTSKADKPLS